jgi:hypothetical protein
MAMAIPYAAATSGRRARDEITKTLLRLGCEKIAFGDEFDKHEIWVQFKHRGRLYHVRDQPKAGRRCGSRKIPGRTIVEPRA